MNVGEYRIVDREFVFSYWYQRDRDLHRWNWEFVVVLHDAFSTKMIIEYEMIDSICFSSLKDLDQFHSMLKHSRIRDDHWHEVKNNQD